MAAGVREGWRGGERGQEIILLRRPILLFPNNEHPLKNDDKKESVWCTAAYGVCSVRFM